MPIKPKRRFEEPPGKKVSTLAFDHPAVIRRHTRYPQTVVWPGLVARVFKSGEHSKKIGSHVAKGRLSGAPIFTLTLEERDTCPSTCLHWRTCYANKLPFVERLMPGPDLERRIGRELAAFQATYPGGFLVRLHVAGDFYSIEYVKRWLSWIRRLPALHIFGYTAWRPDTEIGGLIAAASLRMWDRFAIRLSNNHRPGVPSALTIYDDSPAQARTTICPAQTGKSDCCGTCALCWDARNRHIGFLNH